LARGSCGDHRTLKTQGNLERTQILSVRMIGGCAANATTYDTRETPLLKRLAKERRASK
jgi:hypothetical protein